MTAPSFLLKDVQSHKAFKEILASALINLCENRVSQVPFISELTEGATV